MSLGIVLKDRRVSMGMSVEDVSEKSGIPVNIILDVENSYNADSQVICGIVSAIYRRAGGSTMYTESPKLSMYKVIVGDLYLCDSSTVGHYKYTDNEDDAEVMPYNKVLVVQRHLTPNKHWEIVSAD